MTSIDPTVTILLVEDDPNDVFIMKRALKKAEIANPLHVASDGQQAIHYLSGVDVYSDRAQFPLPGIVFLDLKLPYKSGFEILSWIRGEPNLNSTAVMILTSSSEERDITESRRLGARDFLVKPPTPETLLKAMAALPKKPGQR